MTTWEQPLLIVLAKGTPDESVLDACKTTKPNASTNQSGCRNPTNCGTCKNDANS